MAFFAHVGGFAFGALITLGLRRRGSVEPQDYDAAAGTGRPTCPNTVERVLSRP